jgi:hypothetical protein
MWLFPPKVLRVHRCMPLGKKREESACPERRFKHLHWQETFQMLRKATCACMHLLYWSYKHVHIDKYSMHQACAPGQISTLVCASSILMSPYLEALSHVFFGMWVHSMPLERSQHSLNSNIYCFLRRGKSTTYILFPKTCHGFQLWSSINPNCSQAPLIFPRHSDLPEAYCLFDKARYVFIPAAVMRVIYELS